MFRFIHVYRLNPRKMVENCVTQKHRDILGNCAADLLVRKGITLKNSVCDPRLQLSLVMFRLEIKKDTSEGLKRDDLVDLKLKKKSREGKLTYIGYYIPLIRITTQFLPTPMLVMGPTVNAYFEQLFKAILFILRIFCQSTAESKTQKKR